MCKTYAAPGDTTWIQAHNNTQLDYYNDFDVNVIFPNGNTSYRKIIMEFTLGKYQCGTTEQYCGDWDYTVQNYLMTPTDTFELSRLITPYANASYPRTPWSWKQRYYFDVTDFYPVLKNNAAIRLSYHNYSGGFTGSIRFAFIEGTPPRNVTGIKRLWSGAFAYGKAGDPIENHFAAQNVTVPAGTQQAAIKFTVTGHGSDENYCSEFCSKYYDVYAANNLLARKYIWKDNCGSNDLYPQSGTWVYNRANWCPGELIYPNIHPITVATPGSILPIDINFQSYSGNGGASYITETGLFFYGAYNYTTDASLERVVAPSDYEGDFRANPICSNPVVVIRNNGSATINSIIIEYGVENYPLTTDTISNLTLTSLQDTTLTLQTLQALQTIAGGNTSKFVAHIIKVNGATDGYAINNTIQSAFVTTPDWPEQFKVVLKTNSKATETNWRIENSFGTVIAARSPVAANTTYTDEIKNLADGCYKLVVTDNGCDGLYWWANTSAGKGYLYAANSAGSYLPLTNGLPAYPATLAADFGCGYTQYFRVASTLPASLLWLTGENEGSTNQLHWETSTETNTSNFELQFSTHDTGFVTVATIPAKGNSSVTNTYTATHQPAINASIYYYRVKLLYKDGNYKYSNIVPLIPVINSGDAQITDVKPNPFTNIIQFGITTSQTASANIQLFDISGRLLYRNQQTFQPGYTPVSIDNVSRLASGMYLLVVNIGNQKITRKLIK
ncbi:hypothetical protein FLA_4387 [Filimonas lacunae]|nr:hypothetical protein FLA_4387 [Filimonas lacunae]